MSEKNKKRWQMIGSSIIILAAVAILLPMLFNFVVGLGRLIITIIAILLVACAISLLQVKYRRRQHKAKQSAKQSEDTEATAPEQEAADKEQS